MQTVSYDIYSQPQTLINANGNTADLDAGNVTELLFGADVSAIDASCTLNLYIDTKGDDGTYYQIWASSAITAPGPTNESLGVGLQDAVSFGKIVRIRWTVTATKTATVSLSLIGK